MSKIDICSLSCSELGKALSNLPPFRCKQIAEWIYKKQILSFQEMKNLPHELRDRLEDEFVFPSLALESAQTSSDGTKKFLWRLYDNEHVETVYIPMKGHGTLCISSQVGCKFACRFCASGLGGFRRHLSSSEIIAQVLYAQKEILPAKITHVVFMGIGEPLDNYDAVLKAIRLFNDKQGMGIGARRITISTSGVLPGIKKLAQEGLQIELSVSLHAANNKLRDDLMPVNKKYPLNDLVKACRNYASATGRQVTFEYILIKDLTCTEKAVDELKSFLRGWICKINLIMYNPIVEFDYESPTMDQARRFEKMLKDRGIHATLRSPRGRDIAAACGQLRRLRGAC